MIAKTSKLKNQTFGRRPREPLDVQLTVKFNYGNEPEDSVTVINERSIPMVNDVFENRDRIMRSFVSLLVKSGLRQPKVIKELFPALRLIKRKKK